MVNTLFGKIVLRKFPQAFVREVRQGMFHVLENEQPNARVLGLGSNKNAALKSAAEYTVEFSTERSAMSWERG